MQKLKIISFKILIIFVTSVILINSTIPTLVYAEQDRFMYEQTQNSIKEANQTEDKINDQLDKITDPNLKQQMQDEYEKNHYRVEEFLDLQTLRGNDMSDMNAIANEYMGAYSEYRNNENTTVPEMNNSATAFERYDENGNLTERYKTYLNHISGEYYDKKTMEQQQEEAKTPEEKQKEAEAAKEREEEEYIETLLAKDDEGFLKGEGFWDSIKKELEKQCFQAISIVVTVIGDGVMNLLQSLAIEGAPTAVEVRENNDYIKEKLEARNKDAYLITYAGIAKYFQVDHKSEKVEKAVTPDKNKKSMVDVPFIYYSPSAILGNKIPLFDINFINSDQQIVNPFLADKDGQYSDEMLEKAKERIENLEVSDIWTNKVDELKGKLDQVAEDARGENKANPATSLQKVVAKWYVAIRNLAATGLLIVLVYIGIRIVISAAADEKAKYKTMLKDWAMGLLIVLFMHVIMLLLINLAQAVTEMINSKSIDFIEDTRRRRLLYE